MNLRKPLQVDRFWRRYCYTLKLVSMCGWAEAAVEEAAAEFESVRRIEEIVGVTGLARVHAGDAEIDITAAEKVFNK